MGYSTIFILVGIFAFANAYPEANNRTGRGAILDYISTKLNFAAQKMGIIECRGADKLTGGHLFEHILGKGADFGGDYLCGPTCGGVCVPNQAISQAPISLYPFGCQCNEQRCTQDGPIVHLLARPELKVVCVRDVRCTCAGMNRYGSGSYPYVQKDIGYLCNWINKDRNEAISYQTGVPDSSYYIHPTYSPIRWCSCCPAYSTGYY